MSAALTILRPSWAALSRPPIRRTAARRKGSLAPADAGTIGDRVKPGHDKLLFTFNRTKIYTVIVFPLQNSYLYGFDELEWPHASRFTCHRRGAFPRAASTASGPAAKKFFRIDEQLCCRRSAGTEQPQGRGRTAGKPQCDAARPALGRTSRPSRRSAMDDPIFERALRASESAAESASGVST